MKRFFCPKRIKNCPRSTLLWGAISCVCLAGAIIIGIDGNLPGLVLFYGSAVSFILAIVHTWRKVKYFLILMAASLIGFFVFVVLHNVFYGLGQLAAEIIVLNRLLDFLHAVFFIIATLVCPAGFLIGVVGSIATFITYIDRRQTHEKA
ncbi:hypothetical protein ACFL3G_04785 [Planctomycetota bacterium]